MGQATVACDVEAAALVPSTRSTTCGESKEAAALVPSAFGALTVRGRARALREVARAALKQRLYAQVEPLVWTRIEKT